jgi:hypothetical protein
MVRRTLHGWAFSEICSVVVVLAIALAVAVVVAVVLLLVAPVLAPVLAPAGPRLEVEQERTLAKSLACSP